MSDSKAPWTSYHEDKLKKVFLDRSRRLCKEKVENFVSCAKAEGLMVVFRCRDQNKAMNECTSQYSSPQEFAKFVQYVQDDWKERDLRPCKESWRDLERNATKIHF